MSVSSVLMYIHFSAFKILVYTIKVSTKELFLMVVFLMSGVLMFASIIHYAEKDNFPNIPIAIWWALVTMTTVGYGDKYPVGYIGYGVGCLSVICGVLVIAFTVPIVVNNFSLYYSHAQTRIKLPNRKLKKPKLKSTSSVSSMNSHDSRTGTQSSFLSHDHKDVMSPRGVVLQEVTSSPEGNVGTRQGVSHRNMTVTTHGSNSLLQDMEDLQVEN